MCIFLSVNLFYEIFFFFLAILLIDASLAEINLKFQQGRQNVNEGFRLIAYKFRITQKQDWESSFVKHK